MLFPLLILIALICIIVIYPVDSATSLPTTAGEDIKSRVYLRGFYQAFLILTKLLKSRKCRHLFSFIIRSNRWKGQLHLLGLYIHRACDVTLRNSFFEISCYTRAHVKILFEKTKRKTFPWEYLLIHDNFYIPQQ